LIAHTRGRTAADNVLLGGQSSWAHEPLPGVPDSVATGRRRPSARRRLVSRAQRTYRPTRHSWQ
jgi:hypothetical protein